VVPLASANAGDNRVSRDPRPRGVCSVDQS
jgi:hypothetical protein